MDSINRKIFFEITPGTIIKILFAGLLIWLAYLIREVIAILFFAFILVSILEPMVAWLKQKKIPKIVAVLMIYLGMLAFLAVIVSLLVSPIIDQTDQLRISFPQYWETIATRFSSFSQILNNYGVSQQIKSYLDTLTTTLPVATSDIFSRIGNFIGNIFAFFVILVITFYLLVEENAPKKILRSVLPADSLPYAYQLFNRIEKQLGLWLRGQLILCFSIFILVYLVLLALGVKYALILAIIAGLLEFIPYLGPAFSGFIAVSLTLLHSPIQALLVLICYILIQIFENNILVPNVMRKAVGLNPVISICALLIGVRLGGFAGVILAIPLATALSVFFEDFLEKKHSDEVRLE